MLKRLILPLIILLGTLPLHGSLVPTEVMYHAQGLDEHDFIEIYNAGETAIQVGGYTFSAGIEFTFQPYSLQPAEYMIVVRDAAHFQARYQTQDSPYYREGNEHLYIAGVWSKELSNKGETITLSDTGGSTVFSFTYNDENGWPLEADGLGSSLELEDPAAYAAILDVDSRNQYLDDATHWQASVSFHGNPGTHGSKAEASILINEVLANTDTEITDSVELYNPTEAEIDLSGWYLSDASGNYTKFRIPDNTTLVPGAFLSYNETHFNPEGEWKNGPNAVTGPNDFSFSGSKGDEVYLTRADPRGNITGIVDSVSFGATLSGESLGRWPDGKDNLVPLSSVTIGAENSTPRIGPVLISEVMYHPNSLDEGTLEFIELYNASSESQELGKWTLADAVDFLFPEGTLLPANSYLLITGFNPEDPALESAFRTAYRLDSSIPILGPWAGSLNNSADNVMLYRRDTDGDLILDETTGSSEYPLVLEDQVPYEDSGAWPNRADGTGPSLSRKSYNSPGFEPDNWRSSNEFGGNPGTIGLAQRWVTINEVLTHTDPPLLDTIELYNPGTSIIDLSGWYLSDTNEAESDIELFRKFRIPDGTTLAPGAYITFNQTQFNPNIDPETETGTPEPHHFGLSSSRKEDITLANADTEGNLLGIVDHVEVDPTANSISHGLWPDTEGKFYPMEQRTLGSANSSPKTGPLVFTEIQYNPGNMVNSNELEFLEIHNIGGEIIQLGNDSETGGSWQVDGAVEYTFLPNQELAPDSTLVLVGFDPSDQSKLQAFLGHYSLSESPVIYGPWSGSLSNGGETVRIEQPDNLEFPGDGSPAFYPMVHIESISYNDTSPWPLEPDGQGASLGRVSVVSWADTGEAWQALAPPTPGTPQQTVSSPPSITSTPITDAYEGESYTYFIQSEAPDSPTPPTITAIGLTTWLTFSDYGDGTAILRGTPPAEHTGFSILTIKASAQGESVEQKFGITVHDADKDTDQDGAPDGVESRLGTDKDDPDSKPSRLSHETEFLAHTGSNIWVSLDWLGTYLDNLDGWIYHISLGWLYVPAEYSGPGFWIWDPQPELGWLWTDKASYPWLYDETKGWIYYKESSTNPREFYLDQDSEWKLW